MNLYDPSWSVMLGITRKAEGVVAENTEAEIYMQPAEVRSEEGSLLRASGRAIAQDQKIHPEKTSFILYFWGTRKVPWRYDGELWGFNDQYLSIWGFPVAQMINNPPAMQKTQVWSLGPEDPLQKEMATHSSVFVWRIPWTEKPGGLLWSIGSQRVLYDLVARQQTTSACFKYLLHAIVLI